MKKFAPIAIAGALFLSAGASVYASDNSGSNLDFKSQKIAVEQPEKQESYNPNWVRAAWAVGTNAAKAVCRAADEVAMYGSLYGVSPAEKDISSKDAEVIFNK
ncbi:hypothetical protein SAMN04487866_10931 [Thermoactinomyces sp. DSM 45891]|uniref:hypothetical protein n=1 Tax=unclassified Thermoactinomyces TaxID=2634588 RepID=UPI000898E920|nr:MULTISPECIES: hypothetical protein [unclassified Thermoactinomyces]SDZ05810.1 hypothetical protein SAMN05444416_112110 [Thermoactinomyces sp. DSM 45892]SFX48030.1 hypothetical protein SAMN04487866_10931 [Thermoactinomyces sp. DSM 45891]